MRSQVLEFRLRLLNVLNLSDALNQAARYWHTRSVALSETKKCSSGLRCGDAGSECRAPTGRGHILGIVSGWGRPTPLSGIFLTESWAEHLCQHTRVVIADRAAEQRVRSFHVGDGPVILSHFISAYATEA